MRQTPPSLTQALDLLGLVKAVFPRDGGLRFFTEFDFELSGVKYCRCCGDVPRCRDCARLRSGQRLRCASEPLDEQALVAKLAVEAFVGAVLPRLTGIVEHGGNARA